MRLFLAPMEGVIDHHFRTLYSEIGGVDICVSEFIRVNDLPTPAKTLLRECPELAFSNPDIGQYSVTTGGIPLRIQLLGSNPETLSSTAQTAARLGASAIDLNFGCPAKTVNNSKGGSVLLKQPDLVNHIVAAVRNAVPEDIPVTAKIRLGFEDRSLYLDNALAIAAAGADELCVHARSRADGYNPPAYWAYIAHIVEQVDIPVIANGEIWSVQDWARCKEESQCNDFMMGRGLIACPDLALQIKACAAGETYQPLQWSQVLTLLERFYRATRDAYPKRFLGNRLKQWLFYLQMHYPEAQVFFQTIKRFKHAYEFEAAFTSVPRSLQAVDLDHNPNDRLHSATDFSYKNPDARFQRL
ncbi:MAG: tRNA-dihydrouridine synthase family protein [Pseudomonadaceae bacterium]|nr:tRNA-dihydrouridine synthase family protein [Pseudomonadaceae bacterium]